MAKASEVLRKYKTTDDKKTDKDNDADDKKGGSVKRNALIDFIAKRKKG